MRLLLIALVALNSAPLFAADAPVSDPLKQPPLQVIKAELNDRSKIEIDPSGTVSVVEADGSKTPAPDGTLTLKDGTPFVVKNGHMANGN